MEEISELQAIKQFANLMNGFIASPPQAAKDIADALVAQFRTIVVTGVRDHFRFEWGDSTPHKLSRFADIRTEDFGGWETSRFQWIGISLELAANEDDDDTALNAFLYFAPAGDDEPSGSIEFDREDLDRQVSRFLGNKHVAQLLATKPSRITAFASEVG